MFSSVRNFRKSYSAKSLRSGGFTLVELLVTITIFVILTGIVLFNQSRFNSTILLTNLAYDTALTVRQAQTYGLNIKEFNSDNVSTNFLPYGVHFDISNSNFSKSFILFADLDYDPTIEGVIKSDGIYNGPENSSTEPDPLKCQSSMGCVSRYSIKRGNIISDLCVNSKIVDDVYTDGDCGWDTLDILFQRPNPDAFIRTDGVVGITYDDATIILQSADGDGYRKIKVSKNGLIEIKNN